MVFATGKSKPQAPIPEHWIQTFAQNTNQRDFDLFFASWKEKEKFFFYKKQPPLLWKPNACLRVRGVILNSWSRLIVWKKAGSIALVSKQFLEKPEAKVQPEAQQLPLPKVQKASAVLLWIPDTRTGWICWRNVLSQLKRTQPKPARAGVTQRAALGPLTSLPELPLGLRTSTCSLVS